MSHRAAQRGPAGGLKSHIYRLGLTALLEDEAGPTPAELRALTVNRYLLPGLSPLTTQISAPVVVHCRPDGVEVTT